MTSTGRPTLECRHTQQLDNAECFHMLLTKIRISRLSTPWLTSELLRQGVHEQLQPGILSFHNPYRLMASLLVDDGTGSAPATRDQISSIESQTDRVQMSVVRSATAKIQLGHRQNDQIIDQIEAESKLPCRACYVPRTAYNTLRQISINNSMVPVVWAKCQDDRRFDCTCCGRSDTQSIHLEMVSSCRL